MKSETAEDETEERAVSSVRLRRDGFELSKLKLEKITNLSTENHFDLQTKFIFYVSVLSHQNACGDCLISYFNTFAKNMNFATLKSDRSTDQYGLTTPADATM
jgi:hypothetical protein